MNNNDGLIAYLHEIKSHLNKYQAELEALSKQAKQRPLSDIEYRALERLLQLSIEASVGLAKHWVKALNEVSPNDAYQAFKMLKGFQCLNDEALLLWHKIIGMRNALVHGYLDIDETAIIDVVRTKKYTVIFEFAEQALEALKHS